MELFKVKIGLGVLLITYAASIFVIYFTESAGLASQVELTMNNKSDDDVNYRFRLQSKCVSISQPKGTIKGGHAKTVLGMYILCSQKTMKFQVLSFTGLA